MGRSRYTDLIELVFFASDRTLKLPFSNQFTDYSCEAMFDEEGCPNLRDCLTVKKELIVPIQRPMVTVIAESRNRGDK